MIISRIVECSEIVELGTTCIASGSPNKTADYVRKEIGGECCRVFSQQANKNPSINIAKQFIQVNVKIMKH